MRLTLEREKELRAYWSSFPTSPVHEILFELDVVRAELVEAETNASAFAEGSAEWEDELRFAKAELEETKQKLLHSQSTWADRTQERDTLLDCVRECTKTLQDHLRTVSLDWYVSEFAKSEETIVGFIHNSDLRKRAAISFKDLQKLSVSIRARLAKKGIEL